MESTLTCAKILCYFGFAIPAFAFLVDRYFLRPRLGPVMFILACLACYSILLVALFIMDETGIDGKSRGYFQDSSGRSELFLDQQALIPLWQSIEGRSVFPLCSLALVPMWSLLVYLVLWLSFCFRHLLNHVATPYEYRVFAFSRLIRLLSAPT